MVELRILSGKMAGRIIVARHFPFSIGRSTASALCLNEPGIWNQHARLELAQPAGDIVARKESGASLSVNGDVLDHCSLHPGDVIELGSVKIQFLMAPPLLRSGQLAEAGPWLLLLLVTALQAALIIWLLS